MASISSALANHKIAFFTIYVQISVSLPDSEMLLALTIMQRAMVLLCQVQVSTTKDQPLSKWGHGWQFRHRLIPHMSINMHTS